MNEIDQKALNTKILETMQNNGSYNKLHSKFLSLVSEAGMNSNLKILKPYKNFRKGIPYIYAAQLVMHYLIAFKFHNTIHSVLTESEQNPVFRNENFEEVFRKLRLPMNTISPIKDVQIHPNGRERMITGCFYANRNRLREEMLVRLNRLFESKNERPQLVTFSPHHKVYEGQKSSKNKINTNNHTKAPDLKQVEGENRNFRASVAGIRKNKPVAKEKSTKKSDMTARNDGFKFKKIEVSDETYTNTGLSSGAYEIDFKQLPRGATIKYSDDVHKPFSANRDPNTFQLPKAKGKFQAANDDISSGNYDTPIDLADTSDRY